MAKVRPWRFRDSIGLTTGVLQERQVFLRNAGPSNRFGVPYPDGSSRSPTLRAVTTFSLGLGMVRDGQESPAEATECRRSGSEPIRG